MWNGHSDIRWEDTNAFVKASPWITYVIVLEEYDKSIGSIQ